MKLLLGGVLISLLAMPAFPGPKGILIKLTIQAPDEQRDALVSRISREIRKSPDVEIVGSGENYEVAVLCIRSSSTPDLLACGVNYLHHTEIGYFKEYVKPGNEKLWDSVVDLVKLDNVVMLQTVIEVGTGKLDYLASAIGDTLNAQFLENFRTAHFSAQ